MKTNRHTKTDIIRGISRGVVSLLFFFAATMLSHAETTSYETKRESLFPQVSRLLWDSHFTWGADVGASIDIDVEDMSTFNADMYFGYKNSIIKFAGIGAGVHRSFGKGNNFIPVYAMLRSSFRNKPSLVFLDLRFGYSFNTIADYGSHGGFYGGVGIGFNLSQSKRCNTHIILSYACLAMDHDKQQTSEDTYTGKYINYAELKFGISF